MEQWSWSKPTKKPNKYLLRKLLLRFVGGAAQMFKIPHNLAWSLNVGWYNPPFVSVTSLLVASTNIMWSLATHFKSSAFILLLCHCVILDCYMYSSISVDSLPIASTNMQSLAAFFESSFSHHFEFCSVSLLCAFFSLLPFFNFQILISDQPHISCHPLECMHYCVHLFELQLEE